LLPGSVTLLDRDAELGRFVDGLLLRRRSAQRTARPRGVLLNLAAHSICMNDLPRPQSAKIAARPNFTAQRTIAC
jgi:hypothetical protein